MIRDSGWKGRVVPAYRPDAVVDPDFAGFCAQPRQARRDHRRGHRHLDRLSRRAPQAPRLLQVVRRDLVATTATRRAATADLVAGEAAGALRQGPRRQGRRAASASCSAAQMLTEMARMSLDDGLVLQIHPGAWRNHSPSMLQKFGRDKGFDIPTAHRLRRAR